MKKLCIPSFILTILWITLGCEVVVDAEVPEFHTSIVLNGLFRPDSSITVKLTRDQSTLNRAPFFYLIKDANVILLENGVEVAQMKEDSLQGFYHSNYIPKPGIEYEIKAEKKGYKSVSAVSTIPESSSIKLRIESLIRGKVHTTSHFESDGAGGYIPINDTSYVEYNIQFSFDDQIGIDYYEVKLFQWMNEPEYFYNSDTSYTIDNYQFREVPLIVDDEHQDNLDAYKNIQLFDDDLFEGQSKRISGKIFSRVSSRYIGDEADSAKYILQVRHLSEDYYEYIRRLDIQKNVANDPFSEPINVFSNVKNGFGIFAGYHATNLEFTLRKGD